MASALTTARPVLPAAPVTRIIGGSSLLAGCGCQLEQAARTERNLVELDVARQKPERVLDRLREQRPDRNRTGLAGTLDAERIERRRRHGVADVHVRHVQ